LSVRSTSGGRGCPVAEWRCSPLAKVRVLLSETGEPHDGEFVWKNAAELVWECSDDCSHPTHEEDDG
jgi:hypothetical protein